MKNIFLYFITLLTFTTVVAQPGVLDSDFSADGKILDSLGTGSDKGTGIAVQPDGKILVGGRADIQGDVDFVIIRYNTDGSLDNSFGSYGKTSANFGSQYNDYANEMLLESDGKITLAGHTDLGSSNTSICLARFLPDGSTDPSFGNSGMVITDLGSISDYGYSLAQNDEGKYAVSGKSAEDLYVAMYTENGTLDAGFGTGGIARILAPNGFVYYGYDLAFQQDGKLLVGGTYGENGNINFFAARFNTDGSLDNTFSVNGMVDTDFSNNSADWGFTIEIINGGKILLAGSTYSAGNGNDIALIRYNSDGTLDQSFNGSGKLSIDFGNDERANAMLLQPDGKLLLGGTTYNSTLDETKYMLTRLNSDGTVDNTFGTSGVTYTTFGTYTYYDFENIALQPDLKIAVTGGAGNFGALLDIATARYLSGLNVGVINFSAANLMPLVYPNPVRQTEVLEYTLLQNEVISIELVDMNGKLVKTFVSAAQRNAGKQRETLEFPANMTSGNYIISLRSNTGKQDVQLVKN